MNFIVSFDVGSPCELLDYDACIIRRRISPGRVSCSPLGTEAAIEHVGSTAVIGLWAKPVIDIMVGVSQLSEIEGRIVAPEAAGYEYVKGYEKQLPERRYFRKPRGGPRAYHLHGVVKGSDFWIRHLAFREHLRAHPESAAAYYELKRDLATRFSKDDYTEAKRPFVEGILASCGC